ncbi:hypothetical protein TNCV_1227631 [Trichonephila clavipes]|nr:hypothetical protein TNCV_1227631 [Trichonephila clavipes]
MEKKLKAVPMGFSRSSIPYEEFEDEPGATSEEVKVEPKITLFALRLPKPNSKGVSMSPYHGAQNRSGGVQRRSFHSCSQEALWTTTQGPPIVISASICKTSYQVIGCSDYELRHISRYRNIIKYGYSAALQWLFGLKV